MCLDKEVGPFKSFVEEVPRVPGKKDSLFGVGGTAGSQNLVGLGRRRDVNLRGVGVDSPVIHSHRMDYPTGSKDFPDLILVWDESDLTDVDA